MPDARLRHCRPREIDGRHTGPITRGPLAYLLRNRFYIGEVVYKGQICPGEHPPILDRDLFEAVQQRLAEQHKGYHATAAELPRALLNFAKRALP